MLVDNGPRLGVVHTLPVHIEESAVVPLLNDDENEPDRKAR